MVLFKCGSHLAAEREGQPTVMLRLGCLETAVSSLSLGHIWRSDGADWFDPKTPLDEFEGPYAPPPVAPARLAGDD